MKRSVSLAKVSLKAVCALVLCAFVSIGCVQSAPDDHGDRGDPVEQVDEVDELARASADGPCVTACTAAREVKLAQCRRIQNGALRQECINAAWSEWNACVQRCL